MLIRPSIIKMPAASYPINPIAKVGCTTHVYRAPDKSECTKGFACKPYAVNMNDCVDTTYCGFTLGGTAVIGVIGVIGGALIS